jgi:hypothetical protein
VVGIASFNIGDPPELWEELGFVVDDGCVWVSGICHRLNAAGQGIVSWSLRGLSSLTELPLAEDAPDFRPNPRHPNGVIALDHVVIVTPDLERTVSAFERQGIPLRRTRQVGTTERPNTQAFFRLGDAIVEVVGNSRRADPGEARFYGLAFTVEDLDATASYLGRRLRPPKPAVQPGRQIATLDRSVGSQVPLAFMSPPTSMRGRREPRELAKPGSANLLAPDYGLTSRLTRRQDRGDA